MSIYKGNINLAGAGKSAYDHAVAGGYTGTEEEFNAILAGIKDIRSGGINPNLLDNWYFGNPVNQRGKTEYTDDTYAIDRWKNNYKNNVVTVEDGGVRWAWGRTAGAGSSFFHQPIEMPLPAGTYTISALVVENIGSSFMYLGEGGSAIDGTITATPGLISKTVTVVDGVTAPRVQFTISEGASVKLAAIKLELGDTQTLAHQDANGNWVLNEIPNYNEQLLRCQRYFYRTYGNDGSLAIAYTTSNAYVGITFPVPMRVKPAVTTGGTVLLWYNNANHEVVCGEAASGIGTDVPGAQVRLTCSNATLTAGQVYSLQASGPIYFDANL